MLQIQTILQIAVKYFSDMFHSNGPTDTTTLIEAIEPFVSTNMNNFLTQEFRADEVHKALKQMHPKKSPDPDGMPPLFYQHFWSLVGDCVTKTVLDFLIMVLPLQSSMKPILHSFQK